MVINLLLFVQTEQLILLGLKLIFNLNLPALFPALIRLSLQLSEKKIFSKNCNP